MPEKIIFLDVDGVLNYSHYTNDTTNDIDPAKVQMLADLCEKTNAKVVITSSWRGSKNYTPRIYTVLRDILNTYDVPVLGDAPYIELEFVQKHETSNTIDFTDCNTFKYSTGRGAEVKQYIDEHHIEKYVIFDDEDWDWKSYGLAEHWCKSTYYDEHHGGLQPSHINKALKLLT